MKRHPQSSEPRTITPNYPPTLPAATVWSVREHAPLPARALGPKAMTLQIRRQQRHRHESAHESLRTTPSTLTGADDALTILLIGAQRSLFVERTQRHPDGVRLTQFMVFERKEEFLQWSQADPLRFADPRLHQRIFKRGADFFDDRR